MLEIYLNSLYSVTADWPMTIILGTLSTRTLLITPLQLTIRSRLRRYDSIQPLLQSVTASHSLSLAKKSNLRKDLYVKYNCSPLKTIGISAAQLPLFVGMSYSIQQILSKTTNTEFLWLENLAVSDPSSILPLTLSAIHLINISSFNPLSSNASKRLGYFISFLMIPISAYIPSGILLYWITSATHAFVTNIFSYYYYKVLIEPSAAVQSNTSSNSQSDDVRSMCFSKEAAIVALLFQICHLLYFGIRNPRTKFGQEIKPFLILHAITWIILEFFDYGMWNANLQNKCYDMISVTGTMTVAGPAFSINSMFWHNRKPHGINDWDAKMFFLCISVSSLILLLQSETNDTFLPAIPIPKGPYRNQEITRNIWWTDNFWIEITLLPLYAAPLLRGIWDNCFIPQKRFGRCVAQSALLSVLGLLGAFITNRMAWGSVWCFVTGFQLILFDVHVVLSAFEKTDAAHHPFSIGSTNKKRR